MIGGKGIIVVGGTGMGKTTFIKQCLSMVNKDVVYLYDVNNEYEDYTPENYALPDFKDFCNKAVLLKQSVIVFEEATIFLDNRGSNNQVISMLVRKRHTENTYFLVFHTLRSIPKNLLGLCNLMVLHKTNGDNLEVVDKLGNARVTSAYKEISSAGMLKSPTGKLYSPSKIVHLL